MWCGWGLGGAAVLLSSFAVNKQQDWAAGWPCLHVLTHISTHWGRVAHICVNKLNNIGSDNGLSPGRRQAIISTNDKKMLNRTLGANFSDILGEIHAISFKKMHLKMSSGKWRPFCLGLNVLNILSYHVVHGNVLMRLPGTCIDFYFLSLNPFFHCIFVFFGFSPFSYCTTVICNMATNKLHICTLMNSIVLCERRVDTHPANFKILHERQKMVLISFYQNYGRN